MRSARPRQASRTKALILPANWRGRRRPRRQSPSPGSADPSAPGKAHLVGAVLVAGDDAHPSAPGRRLRPPPAHGGKRPPIAAPARSRRFFANGPRRLPRKRAERVRTGDDHNRPSGERRFSAILFPERARRRKRILRAFKGVVRAARAAMIAMAPEKPFAPSSRGDVAAFRKSRSRRRAGAMSRRFGKAVRAVRQGRAVARGGACRRRERAKNALRRRQGMAFPPSLLRGPLNSPPPPRRVRLGCRPARSCPGARCRRG